MEGYIFGTLVCLQIRCKCNANASNGGGNFISGDCTNSRHGDLLHIAIGIFSLDYKMNINRLIRRCIKCDDAIFAITKIISLRLVI